MRLLSLMRRLGLLSLVLPCSTMLLPSIPTSAAGPPAIPIELRPSDAQGRALPGTGYYQVVAHAGATIQLDAFIGNRGHRRAGIDLVPVDATSGEYGAISYNLPGQARTRVGAWVMLSHRWVSLAPGRGMVVPFTLHVPRTLKPGQYIGGLTAFVPASHATLRHGFGLTMQTRIVDAIEITIPGRSVARLAVPGVGPTDRSDDLSVLVHIRNTGTVLLKGYGYLWVYALHSTKPWIHRSFAVDTTVPGTTVDYPLHWAHRVPAGVYRYAVSLKWTQGSYQTDTTPHLLHWSAGHISAQGWFHTP